MRAVTGLLALAAALTASSASLAESPADAFARLGLLGRWAYDCARPDSYAMTYQRTSGGTSVLSRASFADRRTPGRTILSVIDNVRQTAANMVAYRSSRPPDEKSSVFAEQVILLEKNRYRILSLVMSDGYVVIRNGKDETGRPMPWVYRCP